MSDQATQLLLDRLTGLEWGLAALVNNMHERGLATRFDVADCFRQMAATQERPGVAATLASVATKLDEMETALKGIPRVMKPKSRPR